MKKEALLVGINEYANPAHNLRGCVNDVRRMETLLAGFGFGDIRVLLNDRATAENILGELKRIVSRSGPSDVILFYYSGHGSQVFDGSGDERDRLDEILCPHDTDFDRNRFIRDDDLRILFGFAHPRTLLEVLLDCCHSGTGLRSGNRAGGARFLPSPVSVNGRQPVRGIRRMGASLRNAVLWAACKSARTAAEDRIGGEWGGAFTTCFCKVARPGVPREGLLSTVRFRIREQGFSQTPQLETEKLFRQTPFLTPPVRRRA